MHSKVKILFTAACLMIFFAVLPLAASAEEHHGHAGGFHGRIVPRNTFIYRPFVYGWGWDPFWDPYWEMPYGYYQSNTGTIKLQDVDKHDEVYLNGSLAGDAGHLKSMHLPPGAYGLEVKHNGKDVMNQRIYVTAGKTVKLDVGDKVSQG